MSNNMKLGLGIVVVVIVIIAIWMLSSSSSAPLGDETSMATTSDTMNGGETGSTGGSMDTSASASQQTFRSLLTQTGNHECLYALASNTQSHHVVQISDGKMYGEFRTTDASGKAINSLMVYDGRYLYAWVEGKTTGTKTILASLDQLPEALPSDLTSGAIFGSADQNVSWDCHAWIPDTAKLAPPTYVKFTAAS